jgi:L-alanine-DL-glutamate epimerase-like enolase superfamily enzyme
MRIGVMDGSPARSAARVRAARKALGPDIKLMADAHGTWTVAEAKAFCRMVEECDLFWFEEPVSADDKAGQAEVRRSSAVPISSGESEFTRHDFRELAELRAADVLQPDLAIAGGLTEGLRISAIASAFNLRLAPHLWSGAPAFAAGLHLAASQSAGFILEYSLGHNPMLHDLIEEDFPVVDGFVEVPDRPGLGITVREEFLRTYGRSA